MAVYFDRPLTFAVASPLHLCLTWHPVHPLLAVASFSNVDGGFVSIYDDQGTMVTKVDIPGEGSSAHICALEWHPQKKTLAIACEGGDLYGYSDKQCIQSPSQHACSVSVLRWSESGSRLVTADRNGSLVGWRLDSKGHFEVVFHHELKDSLTRVAFRATASDGRPPELDIGQLARAAVSGDEEALDLFSGFQANEGSGQARRQNDLSFYIGAESGIVYFVNSDGSCMEVVPAGYPIAGLLYHGVSERVVVVINDPPAIVQFKSQPDGSLEEVSTIKLARRMLDVEAVWVAEGRMLALTIETELTVRLFDVDSADNFTLTMDGNQNGVEHVTDVAYSPQNNVLALGTNLGNVQKWAYVKSAAGGEADAKCWHSRGKSTIKEAVKQMRWSCSSNCLAVNTTISTYLLVSQPVLCSFTEQSAAVQLSANRLLVETLVSGKRLQLETEVKIRGMDTSADNLAVWDERNCVVYETNPDAGRIRQVGSFACAAAQLVLYDQSVYAMEGGKIQVRTFQGTVKQSLGFLENEGQIIAVDICGTFLGAATSLGMVRLWEISRREAKVFTNPKNLTNSSTKDLGIVTSLKVNCDGSKISILTSEAPDLVVWDVEADAVLTFDEFVKPKEEREENRITSHCWDPREPRILVCETRSKGHSHDASGGEVKVYFLFVTSEHGIMVQDTAMVVHGGHVQLLGVRVPHYYLFKEDVGQRDAGKQFLVEKCAMRDFAGLDESDPATKEAMMNFSFNLTVGNMDEAFRAIKKIKNAKVWESMARMCVKTKRLDVALVCLGSMSHARGAKALGRATKTTDGPLEARVAMLAVQLGMLEEAEELYKASSRFDLLNRFYQASGQWDNAIETAKTNDRIHLRSTFYNYAKYLENKGDFQKAIPNYERSETQRFEVPRMLFEDLTALENYVMGSGDDSLLKWWAQYMESVGEMETALQCYERAKDSLSLVRVYCYCNNLKKAAEIGNESGSRAACYHLGRKYENNGDVKEAVHFFTRAQAYNNAIRICKEQGMEDQLLNLALMGKSSDMLDVARYYEGQSDQTDKAVMLYHKAGLVNRAFELAFVSDRRSAVEQLAAHLDERVDPRILRKCADYFVDSGQADKAVDLLAKAKEYAMAVALCVEQNVSLTEEVAEMLTPPKEAMDSGTRSKLLEKMAQHCYQLENYHLATKKFTQAGNKLMAMKALLKSGDTERIIFFANVSRQRDIYVMAANYLQTLDWRNEPDVMKTIVAFYTKAKAPELLAGFYDACAQLEIDEFQDYGKALGALNEAYKCMTKAQGRNEIGGGRDKLDRLSLRLELVKKFVHAKRIADEEPAESMRLCQSLLKEMDQQETGLRMGDIYAFAVERYARQLNYKTAYGLMEEMQSRLPNVNLSFYIDPAVVSAVHQNLGMTYDNGTTAKGGSGERRTLRRNGPLTNSEENNEVDEDIKESVLDSVY